MTSKMKKTFVLMGMGVLVVSFQNCGSQYDLVGKANSQNETMKLTLDGQNDLTDEVMDPSMEVDGGSRGPDSIAGDIAPGDAMNPGNEVVAPPLSAPSVAADVPAVKSDDSETNTIQPYIEASIPDKSEEMSDGELVAYCKGLKKNLKFGLNLSENGILRNIRGAVKVNITQAALFEDIRGNVGVSGTSASAKIEMVQNVHGKLVVCDASIKELNGFRGNVTVVNGDISKVKDVHGAVRVINGSINELEDHRGLLMVNGVSF